MNKVYVGKGKKFGQYGNISIGVRYSELTPNEGGYVNLIVSELREPDKYGKTHTVYLDDYKPKPATQTMARMQEEDDLPF